MSEAKTMFASLAQCRRSAFTVRENCCSSSEASRRHAPDGKLSDASLATKRSFPKASAHSLIRLRISP